MQAAARSRHMTALLVSELCADRPVHFTLDSRKYSSAFLGRNAIRCIFTKIVPELSPTLRQRIDCSMVDSYPI